MRTKFNGLMFALLLLGFTACTNEKDNDFSKIKQMEKQLFEKNDLLNKDSIASALIGRYESFAHTYKEDKNAAEFLFKSAEIANSLNMHIRAINTYQFIYTNYPDYDKSPESLFLCGFISENQLGDLEKAASYYTQFIESYPNHHLKEDAEASIKYLGKDPAEMIKEFEAKNKAIEEAKK